MLVLVAALLGFGACDAFFAGSISVLRAPLVHRYRGGEQQVEVAVVGDWTT